MTLFTDVMANFLATKPDYQLEVPDNWKQGRTCFGGLTAALLVAAIQNDNPDLPPLRTMQINFIGPSEGELTVRHDLLRRGKNNVTFRAQLDSALGAGTHGYFTFGAHRPLPKQCDYPIIDLPPRDESRPLFAHRDPLPDFILNFQRCLANNNTGTNITTWSRHVDDKAYAGLWPLIVLADAPPAALAFFDGVQALSSMNWNVNMLCDKPETENGWWLMRSTSQHIQNGYASQIMEVWNTKGERVMDGLQQVAIFA